MPNAVLELIRINTAVIEIQQHITKTGKKLPLFIPWEELQNITLYAYLREFGKIEHLSFEDLIVFKLIDFNEIDSQEKSLMQNLLADNDLHHLQHLLLAGVKPTESLYRESEGSSIGQFLRYKPGRNKPTIYQHAIVEQVNIDQLNNLFFDYAETTEDDSSDAVLSDTPKLSEQSNLLYRERQLQVVSQYNETGEGFESMRLVAARGVHFAKNYFPKQTKSQVYNRRNQQHITYSFSTLFDAGYQADEEPDEEDVRIQRTHQRNLNFINRLKRSPDKKEKKSGAKAAPAERNRRVFENLFWREIQVYINSYSTLFNSNSIQINFGFESKNNPHLSLSWSIDKAGMYASGIRFDWGTGIRRDPHYRRYDNKPKHPNIGYVDIFEFPLDYVRANGVDRLLAYNDNKIALSNLYLSEAEIIFHSMIPMQFHVRRYMIVLPDFTDKVATDMPFTTNFFGIKSKGAYTRARNELTTSFDKQFKRELYKKCVTTRSEYAVAAQSVQINNAMDYRMFNNRQTRVYDHGQLVGPTLPVPNH